jgi:hypothetical protein
MFRGFAKHEALELTVNMLFWSFIYPLFSIIDKDYVKISIIYGD